MNKNELKPLRKRYEGVLKFILAEWGYAGEPENKLYMLNPKPAKEFLDSIDPLLADSAKRLLLRAGDRRYEPAIFDAVTKLLDSIIAWLRSPPVEIKIALELAKSIKAYKIRMEAAPPNPAVPSSKVISQLNIYKGAGGADISVCITDMIDVWAGKDENGKVGPTRYNIADPNVMVKVALVINNHLQKKTLINKINKMIKTASIEKLKKMASV